MTLQRKNFQKPDEKRTFPSTRVDTIKIGDIVVDKQIFEPGWQWSKNIKPIAKTNSCQMHHIGLYISGRMKVRADNGQEIEYGPGDVADIPPGHDGWVVGNEPVVVYWFLNK